MASQNQTGDALRPYTVSTRDLSKSKNALVGLFAYLCDILSCKAKSEADTSCHLSDGSLMTLTRASLAARAEERRLLEETLRDEDNNGLTAAECRRLIRIFRTEELPISYAEVWQDQRERDEGRVLMAQARLRATMAKQPPATSGSNEPEQESPQAADDGTDESQPDETLDPAGSSPNSSEEESESPQQAGESSEGAQPDNSPSPHGPRTSASAIETQPPRQVDETKRAHQRRGFQGAQPDSLPIPHGSRTSASAVETQPPRQADERKRAHQRRGFRHRSEPQEDWEKRMKRAPIMFRARRFEDPDCIEHDGPPSIFSIELDGEGNLVKVALDKRMYPILFHINSPTPSYENAI